MDLNLSGKYAFVCGSTQGIGKAAAMELAELGASVILIARDEAGLTRTRNELSMNAAQRHGYLVADFSKPEELKEKVTAFADKHSPIHILVNNSGGPPPGSVAEAKIEEFEKTFSQHLICNHILVQALIPGMKAEGYGRIINVISTSVKQPLKNLGVSNTIRAAVASWAKTLSAELAPFGITVNNVLPGATLTERLKSIIETKAKQAGKSVEVISKEMLSEIPAGRFGNAHDVGAVIAFLASPSAGYINGINVPVDGGRTGSL